MSMGDIVHVRMTTKELKMIIDIMQTGSVPLPEQDEAYQLIEKLRRFLDEAT